MNVAVGLMLLSLVYAFIAFVRQVVGGQYHSAVLQALVWAAGIGAVVLFAASQFGDTFAVNGIALGKMNFSTQLLLGFLIASPASVLRDALTAIDAHTSVALPALFQPRAVKVGAPPAVPEAAPAPPPAPPLAA